jgi:tetratricopeptide (TPR) repeat protein
MPYERTESLSTQGSLLHYQGDFSAAEDAFQEAALHHARAIHIKELRGLAAFRYVELMLDQRRFAGADSLIEAAVRGSSLPRGWGEKEFVEALYHLAFVRTRIRRADVMGDHSDWNTHGETAVGYGKDFARFGQELRMDWLIPLFRVALSGIARLSCNPGNAVVPIEEAKQRVTKFSNRLFETDVHMEQARLYLALDEKEHARTSIRKAAAVSEEIGYRCKADEINQIVQLCDS